MRLGATSRPRAGNRPVSGRCRAPHRARHFAYRWRPCAAPRAAGGDEEGGVQEVRLPEASDEAIAEEARWLERTMARWLDEEWCPQECHLEIGARVGSSYLQARRQGQSEVAAILLGLPSELSSVDFTEAFVSPYDVANKAVEMLMFRAGHEVCCGSASDKKFLEDSLSM